MLDVQPAEKALEIGFGTGRILQSLASHASRAVGIDLSYGMACVAHSRLAKHNLLSNVVLTLGDGLQLPYPGGFFDAVFASFTLELFDTQEIPLVLRETRRVLRAGGRLGVVSLSLPERPGIMVRIYEWFHMIMPGIVDCHPIPAASLLQQNGFAIRQVECKNMWGLPVEMVVAEKKERG